jgi:hypothetical protein
MGLFDSFFSSKQTGTTTQNTSGTSQTSPWDPQAQALQSGFGYAQDAFSQAQDAPRPTDFVAQYSPEALAAYSQMLGYGTSGVPGIAGASTGAGSSLLGAALPAYAQGLYGLSNFNPQTSTANVLSAAGQYSQNPDVQGMIDASTRDARRAVSEQVLPQIERSAALSGNINSNRTGIAQGIVQRGLADQVGDISAQIRSGLYSQGLGLGLNQGQTADAQRLAALQGATQGALGGATAGVNANTAGVTQAGGLYNIANAGITGQLAGAQAPLSNQLAQYQFGTQSPFDAANNYWNLVGKQMYGQNTSSTGTTTGTTTQTSTPSTASQIGGLIGMGSSLINPFKGLFG